MWFLGGRQGPSPLSHTSRPPWIYHSGGSPEKLIRKSLAQNANSIFLGLECFYIDIPFNYSLLLFNLYPIPLECCANVLHKFCIIWFMQSAFTICNLDSNSEPPSPNMAAAVPDKRRFRKCNNCMSQRPSITYDNHTLCIKCRKQVCDMQIAWNNAASGLLRDPRCSLTITIGYV